MKAWEFTKAQGPNVKISERLADVMGLVDGGFVYSTLFKYSDEGPKEYELILSMYPQENYRTLTYVTIYMQDVPGATAQAAEFLGKRSVNILNSISQNAISDTVIIWKMLVDLSFAGEADIIKEKFSELKEGNDPSVSKLNLIDIKTADVGRVFSTSASKNKTEVRRGAPMVFKDRSIDIGKEYLDILGKFNGSEVMISIDPESWILSVTFFKEDVKLVKMSFDIPDCPGSIGQIVGSIASKGVNLICVFSKVKICYQTMSIEMVADLGHTGMTISKFKDCVVNGLESMNGIFELREYKELK